MLSLRIQADERAIDEIVVEILAPLTPAEVHVRQQPPCRIVRCQLGVRRLVAGFPHGFLPLAWGACDVRDAQRLKHTENLAVTRSERERAGNALMRHTMHLLDNSHHILATHPTYRVNEFWIEPLPFKERVVVKGIGLNRQDAAEAFLAGIKTYIICSHCLVKLKSRPLRDGNEMKNEPVETPTIERLYVVLL